jgi:AAA15 family ATPase/GTPase
MLIKFTLENWLSFSGSEEFSMIASREKQHGTRVPKVAKYQMRILPIAAIYGGNASGKTNLFKALNFVKNLIVKGTQPDATIPVETFKLDAKSIEQPTEFKFELLINDLIYEYSFAVDWKSVIREKLTLINSSSEKVLFDRYDGLPHFDTSLEKDEFLAFAFRGTRDNQLFITNSVSQRVYNFRPIYDWFKDCLELVAPDFRFEAFEQFLDEGHPLYSTMNQMIPMLDTGITHLGGEVISFDNLPLPDAIRTKLQEEIAEGMAVRLVVQPSNERLVVTRKSGELTAKKLVAFHNTKNGGEVQFEIRHESDGSQRIIDLLPAFLEISAKKSHKVYVIDEVDRSLHTLLTRRLIEGYLQSCSNESRSQLLFTTHDALLMDQSLLRRDEMWVAERDQFGASHLIPFSEYEDVRYDKDIRKSYLDGRLGGIPRILFSGSFMPKENK